MRRNLKRRKTILSSTNRSCICARRGSVQYNRRGCLVNENLGKSAIIVRVGIAVKQGRCRFAALIECLSPPERAKRVTPAGREAECAAGKGAKTYGTGFGD